MGSENIMDELATLIRTDIPEGRQSLQDSYTNLARVAEYCEDTYYRCVLNQFFQQKLFLVSREYNLVDVSDLIIRKRPWKRQKTIRHNRWLVLRIRLIH